MNILDEWDDEELDESLFTASGTAVRTPSILIFITV
jgi:hypothetical protein